MPNPYFSEFTVLASNRADLAQAMKGLRKMVIAAIEPDAENTLNNPNLGRTAKKLGLVARGVVFAVDARAVPEKAWAKEIKAWAVAHPHVRLVAMSVNANDLFDLNTTVFEKERRATVPARSLLSAVKQYAADRYGDEGVAMFTDSVDSDKVGEVADAFGDIAGQTPAVIAAVSKSWVHKTVFSIGAPGSGRR